MGGFERAGSATGSIWGSGAATAWRAPEEIAATPAANGNAASWSMLPPANANRVDAAMVAASLGMGDYLDAPAAGGATATAVDLETVVRARVGLEFDHDGGYSYRVTAGAGFEITGAPGDQGLGYEITRTGEYATAWETLAEYVEDLGPAPGGGGGGGGGAAAPTPPVDNPGKPSRPGGGKPPRGGVPWGSKPAPGRGGPKGGAPSEEPEAPKPDKPDTEEPAPPKGGSGGLPYTVGGYPSSRPAGSKYPAYAGKAVSATLPGLPLEDGNEKLTPPIVAGAQHVGSYLPAGTVLTSGWRTDEEQADLIVHYGGGLVDGDLSKSFDACLDNGIVIAWVGDSPHRPGLAFDLSGASLSAIDAAVHECQADHPGDGIKDTILESSNNCVHVDVGG